MHPLREHPIQHLCSALLSIPFTSPLFDPPSFVSSSPAFTLYAAVILFIIPSRPPLFHCISTSTALFCLPSLPSFYLLSHIPSRPPANFPTVPFPTSSFLSISPLIYLSCWARTRSDALPLCLCCMCVLFVSPTCHSETHCFV